MRFYLDHNIYIYSLNDESIGQAVETLKSDSVQFLYSPAHIEEVYTAFVKNGSKYQQNIQRIFEQISKFTDAMRSLANKTVTEELSVRALENIISEENIPKKIPQERVKETKSIRNTIYEKLMREKVGTKVKINKKKIEIPYDSDKDLERILEILGIKVEGV